MSRNANKIPVPKKNAINFCEQAMKCSLYRLFTIYYHTLGHWYAKQRVSSGFVALTGITYQKLIIGRII